MKILLSASACRPDAGSEPALGWRWANTLARDHDVWVLTRGFNRASIETVGPIPRVTFVYVAEPAQTLRRPRPVWWARLYAWQILAYRRAVGLHAEVGFDLAHHVTLASWRLPSLLWRLGIPLVWGPIGGGQSIPPGFARALGPAGAVHEAVRTASQVLSRYDPLVRATLSRAAAVISANSPTTAFLARLGRRDVVQLLETAIPDGISGEHSRRERPAGPLEILWVGSCQPRKALPLLLEAVALLRDGPRVHLTVVGDGPEKRRWKALAGTLGIDRQVTFLGHQPYAATLEYYRNADIFAFTSIRDTSGNVVLEAMAAGVPVITLDWAGGADMVSDDCGMKIPPRSQLQVREAIAEAIARLAADPGLRRRLGEAGQRRAREYFTWDRLYRHVSEVYARAMAGCPHPGGRGA
jgi:glycosyltransferase involved in cell wall biosynthesis